MVPRSQKDRVHLLVVRDARNPILIEVEDVSEDLLENQVVVFGSQSASGDFNPYYSVYKDILSRFQVLKFAQLGSTLAGYYEDARSSLSRARSLSIEALSIANCALGVLGSADMSLKAMVCKL